MCVVGFVFKTNILTKQKQGTDSFLNNYSVFLLLIFFQEQHGQNFLRQQWSNFSFSFQIIDLTRFKPAKTYGLINASLQTLVLARKHYSTIYLTFGKAHIASLKKKIFRCSLVCMCQSMCNSTSTADSFPSPREESSSGISCLRTLREQERSLFSRYLQYFVAFLL